MLISAAVAVSLLTLISTVDGVKNIACYYGTWARYSGLKPEDIDPTICTSVLVSFARVSESLEYMELYDPYDVDQVFPVFYSMRRFTGMKIVLALGGATHPNQRFTAMVENTRLLRTFAENTVLQLRQWGLDGLDVDWEFPLEPISHALFLQALREAINSEILQPGMERLELSAAVPAGIHYISNYDIPLVGRLLDIVYVMAYDYHGPWDAETGHNSPLFPRADDRNQQFNTNWTVNYWYQNGIPKNKLYVGVPTYGRTFILRNPANVNVGSPANGGQIKTFGQSCQQILSQPNSRKFFDVESDVPFAALGSTWLSYANPQSISNKCQWLDREGFGGAMVWSLHQDDFAGVCGLGTFPLVRALKACSETFPTPPTPSPLPTTTTTTSAPGPMPTGSGTCASQPDNTFLIVRGDCAAYIQCWNGISFEFRCPQGLRFTTSCNCCEFPDRAGRTDCGVVTTSTSSPLTTPPTTTPSPTTTRSTTTSGPTTSGIKTTTPVAPTTTGPGGDRQLGSVSCYYGTWARYSGLAPNQIDADLCDRILVSFVKVRSDLLNIEPFESDDLTRVYPVFRQMRSLSTSGLKIIVALGGASHDDTTFDRMLANDATLAQFAFNLVKTMREWQVDGVDVDWEFPENAEMHLSLISALRLAIDTEPLRPGQQRLELMAALPAGKYIKNYDIAKIGALLDFGFIMAYDYHGPWERITGHNSPLFPRSDDPVKTLNVEWTTNHWFLNGFPKHKIHVGVPTYARTFNLRNALDNGVGAEFLGGGLKTYRDVCSSILTSPSVFKFWDSESQVPYAADGSTWISYANISSLANKCRWIVDNGFGGGMVWSLHQDDFDGLCQQGTFPLVRAFRACSDTFPTPPPLPTTPAPPTPEPSTVCAGPGAVLREVPNDCTVFAQCLSGGRVFIQKCPPGLHFSGSCPCCDFPLEVNRNDCNPSTERTAVTSSPTPQQATTSTAASTVSTAESPRTPTTTTTTTATTSRLTTETTSQTTPTTSQTTPTTSQTTPTTSQTTPTTSRTTTRTPTTPPTDGPSSFSGQSDKIACYYGTWSKTTGLTPEGIDPFLCTSLLVAFTQVSRDLSTIVPFDRDDEGDVYPVLVDKKNESGMKIIIALGGATHPNERFYSLVANENLLTTFANNVVRQIRLWEMDGIVVDWEFPDDRQTFVSFISALRIAIETEPRPGGLNKLELSAALNGDIYVDVYDIPVLAALLDISYIMAYDYHGPWEIVTGHNSPLSPRSADKYPSRNVDWTVNHFLSNGMPREKMYLGIPTYAYSFRVVDSRKTGTGVGVEAFGLEYLSYRDVCRNILMEDTVKKFWDFESLVPYAVNGTTWISYANGTSVAHKCAWADDRGLGGLMVWSLQDDDFDGFCGGGTFTLIRSLKRCSGTLPTVMPVIEVTTPGPNPGGPDPSPGPVTGPIDENFCQNRVTGFYEIYGDCANFVRCDRKRTYLMKCGAGLHFDIRCTCCEFIDRANRMDCHNTNQVVQIQPSTTLVPETTPIPNHEFCRGKPNGNYPIARLCFLFYTCSNGITNRAACPYPTIFNTRSNYCADRASTVLIRGDCQF